MISKSELRSIAKARLRDAQVLLRARRFDGAFYLGGYAVEIALKARICRTLKWQGFPDVNAEFQGLQSLKTHDLEILLRLSGAEPKIKAKFLAEWSAVLKLESGEAISTGWQADAATGDRYGDVCAATVGGSVITNTALRKAMREIGAKKGAFTLFAKIRRSDAPGTWDLVVSAPWLESGKLKAMNELVNLLSGSVGEASLHEFSRIATLGTDHPTVRFMVENLATDDGELRVQNTDLFGLQIDEAIVFRAKAPVAHRRAV
jgi:hypothetical protein